MKFNTILSLIIFSIFLSLPQTTHAQEQDSTAVVTQLAALESYPEFPGGIKAFYEFVAKNYRVPFNFRGSGKILTEFVVEKDGSLSNIKVIKHPGKATAKEAIKVLKKSPKWSPGIQNGKPVRTHYSLPISILAS